MRARYSVTAPASPDSSSKSVKNPKPGQRITALTIPELPSIRPYQTLGGVWKPLHTELLLAALGDVDPVVAKTARSIGKQQVAHNGLVYLTGKSLDIGVSIGMFPEALRLYDLLLKAVAERDGETVSKDGTQIILRGETIAIRLRETSLQLPQQAGSTNPGRAEYQPTGLLLFSVDHRHGSDLRTRAQDATDINEFLKKIERFAERLPRLRAARKERERQHEEYMAQQQAKWRREEDQRRQWEEQQRRFNDVTTDIEAWTKAQRIRAYADAYETHHIAKHGSIKTGGAVDGWLQWLHWYAEHLDPITRPNGPSHGPGRNDQTA